jgi:hypothetical protein
MKTKMLSMILGLALAACGGAAGGAGGGGGTVPSGDGTGDTGDNGDVANVGTLTLRNNSSYMIYQMHLSPYDDPAWGADLLNGDPLLPGEGGTAPVFQCSKYDLKLVDDEGGECIVNDIDLCFNDEDWSIDDTDLAICQEGWGH